MLTTQTTNSRPTIKLIDLLRLVTAVRQQKYRFDPAVVSNIIYFTAMFGLKKIEVRNAIVGQVMSQDGWIQTNPIPVIKNFQNVDAVVKIPAEVLCQMRGYVAYLKQSYPNFGSTMHLFPNIAGEQYRNDKLTRHLNRIIAENNNMPGCQVNLTLGKIRQSGICFYYEWTKLKDPNRLHAMAVEKTAEFCGNESRTVERYYL